MCHPVRRPGIDIDLVQIDAIANGSDVRAMPELLRQRVGEGHDRVALARHQHHETVEDAGGL